TPLPYDKVTVAIIQRESEIKITRLAQLKGEWQKLSEVTFFTDERGEENEIFLVEGGKPRKVGQAETKTRWKGKRLVVKGKDQFRLGGQVLERAFTDTWELSADGETLTQTTESYDTRRPARIGVVNRKEMMGSPVVKRVYKRG
ncbi:MAG TPA: hypothetical protein VJT74_11285, partial [Pyrinomonadaceae bacterium]|nr:hypothetical protein [Pyrinomonadaceae bacterium]